MHSVMKKKMLSLLLIKKISRRNRVAPASENKACFLRRPRQGGHLCVESEGWCLASEGGLAGPGRTLSVAERYYRNGASGLPKLSRACTFGQL